MSKIEFMKLKHKDRQLVAKTNPWPAQFPIQRAEGSYLYDDRGEPHLDLLSGICVNNFGHSHPAIQEAYRKQLDQYNFTMVYGEHLQKPQVLWAEMFLKSFPSFGQVYYLTTGTESVEAAMKLSRRATGRKEIISMRRSYHGSTQGSLSLMDDQEFTGRYRPLIPGIKHIRFGEHSDLSMITEQTAAVFSEVYQSATGITIPPDDYHRALRERCDEVGALLVYDEIQTGFGRCGTLMAHSQVDSTPDLLCLGKAMGGGLPVSALIGRGDLLKAFTSDPVFGHISTMGGHPVPTAGAVAAWNLLVETDLLDQSVKRAEQLSRGLYKEKLKDFRQKGLYIALEFQTNEQADAFYNYCNHKRVLTGRFFFNPRAIRLTPPLTISESEVDQALEILNSGIEEVHSYSEDGMS